MIKELLRKILLGFAARENSWDPSLPQDWSGGRYTKSLDDAMEEVASDPVEARFLYLASYWSNDIQELAEDLGVKTVWLDTREDPPREVDLEVDRLLPIDEQLPVEFRRVVVRDMTQDEIAEWKRKNEEDRYELDELQSGEVATTHEATLGGTC